MIKRQFLIKVVSISLAAIMLCGCGGKNPGSEAADNGEDSAVESNEVVEAVEVADSDNAGEAPNAEADEVMDIAEADAVTEGQASADNFDYEAFYEPVLDEIYNTIISGVDPDNPPSRVPSGLEEKIMYDNDNSILQDVGYLIKDVSGDGIPELLIVDNGESDYGGNSLIYGVYTKKDGDIGWTIDGWYRSAHYWIGDDRFGYLGSGGVGITYFGIYHLSKDGTKSEWENFYFTDEVDGDIVYYTNAEGIGDYDISEVVDADTADEFWHYLDAQKAPQLEITSFDDYGFYDSQRTYIPSTISDKISYFKIYSLDSGECEADLDGDGNAETIGYKCTKDDYYYETLTLNFNGKDYELPNINEAYAFFLDGFDVFWLRPGGDRQYVYAQYRTDSDYTSTAIYSFDGDKFEFVDFLDGSVYFWAPDEVGISVYFYPEDLNEFRICKTEYVLGTMSYTQKCRLGDDGLPEPVEEYRYYITSYEPYISAAKKIACYCLEDENVTEGQPGFINEGDMITPYRTDGKTYIDLKVKDAPGLYRILIKEDENGATELDYTEGMEGSTVITDCFDGLVFAG